MTAMTFFTTEALIFLLSSVFTIALSFFKVPVFSLVKFLAVLLVVLIFVLNRFYFSKSRPIPTDRIRLFLIFLSALVVQLAVLSSGGFYSPFVVLIHLYTLGIGLVTNLKNAASFLIFTATVLVLNVMLDQNNLVSFQSDPWSTVLYVVSFVVIVPILNLLISNYKLKDSLYKILVRQVQNKEKQIQLEALRKKSILESLSDLVLVTDKDLNILSVNESVKKSLRLTDQEVINNNIFDVLLLRNKDGLFGNRELLQIDQIVGNKKISRIEGLTLYTNNTSNQDTVNIQISPNFDLEGNLDQITFLLSANKGPSIQRSSFIDLDKARAKYEAMLAQLKNKIITTQFKDLKTQIELVSKSEKDLFTVMELEHRPIRPNYTLRNLDRFCEQVVAHEQSYAQSLGLTLVYNNTQQPELGMINPKNAIVRIPTMPSPFSVAPIDVKWYEILIEKLIELALFLGSSVKNSQVILYISYSQERKYIDIDVSFSHRALSESEKVDLFTEYYGNLAATSRLDLSGGLEGYLVKTIASQLNIPIGLSYNQEQNTTSFILRINRGLT